VLADFEDPSVAQILALGTIGFLPEEVDPDEVGGIRRARVYSGYSGWGPGQLEAELEEGSWIVEPALPDDVFADDPDHLWTGSYAARVPGSTSCVRCRSTPPRTEVG